LNSASAGETIRWERWLPFAGGRRLVRRVYLPFQTETGAIEGYFVFARDLTELESGEWILLNQLAALHASEAVKCGHHGVSSRLHYCDRRSRSGH